MSQKLSQIKRATFYDSLTDVLDRKLIVSGSLSRVEDSLQSLLLKTSLKTVEYKHKCLMVEWFL